MAKKKSASKHSHGKARQGAAHKSAGITRGAKAAPKAPKAAIQATRTKPKLPAYPEPAGGAETATPEIRSDSPFHLFKPSVRALQVNTSAILWLLLAPLATFTAFGVIIGLSAGAVPAAGVTNETIGALSVFGLITLLLLLGVILFSLVIFGGLLVAALKSVRGEPITALQALRDGRHYFWRLFGLTWLLILLSTIGLILLIVPGLYIMKRYFYAGLYMVDEDLSIRDALRASARATSLTRGVWGVLLVCIGLSLLSFFPYFGWVLTCTGAILYSCAPALRYETVRSKIGPYKKPRPNK